MARPSHASEYSFSGTHSPLKSQRSRKSKLDVKVPELPPSKARLMLCPPVLYAQSRNLAEVAEDLLEPPVCPNHRLLVASASEVGIPTENLFVEADDGEMEIRNRVPA